jgi:hypothetical protein
VTSIASQGGVISGARMSGRGRTLLLVGVVVGILLVVMFVRPPAGDGAPLDPGSTDRLGAKGLVLLLREAGNDVRISARTPDASRSTVVLLRDTLDEPRTAALQHWVEAGGTLVVTDVSSSLDPGRPAFSPVNGAAGVTTLSDRCTALRAVAEIREIDAHGALTFDRDDRAPGTVGCYPDGGGDFLVAAPVGRGTVVALGGAGLWVNANLKDSGNAGLAMALLAPRRGSRVQVLSDFADDAADIGVEEPEERSTTDLLPDGYDVARLEVALTFLAAVLWKARRLGRPVREVQPVVIPGSELVAAVGRLHQKGGHRTAAARSLVTRANRRISDRLGLPRSIPAADLARIVADRTGLEAAATARALAPPPPLDDAALVHLAAAADAVADAVTDPSRRPGAAP